MLTLNCNTDGAPLSKSGKKSFLPMQVCLNELSPKLKSQYVLLTGLLMTEREPKCNLMNLYLDKFVEEILFLYTDGITIEKDSKIYVFKFCVTAITVDSVCRPILQNRIQFNGYSGCSWCYQHGEYVYEVHGIRYPVDQESIPRTHESHLSDMEIAQENNIYVRGVKGYSSLLKLPHIDIVWSLSYEYMHGLTLGVVFQMLNLWKNKNCEYRISNNDLEIIEKRYMSVTPTQDVHRLPRADIIKGKMKPKASELRSWLLISSLPCLRGILNEKYFEHYVLLVKSAYTLLKFDAITEAELDQCEIDLITFVIQFEDLYGKENMTFNLHALYHCVQSIRKTGPLCLNSAFPFEAEIFQYKQYVSGPKGRDRQIARKHVQSLIFKSNARKYVKGSEDIMDFCCNLFLSKRLTTFYHQTHQKVTYFGRPL